MKPAGWVAAVAVALALTWGLWPREARHDGATGSPDTAARPGAPAPRAGGAAATPLTRGPEDGALAASTPVLTELPGERDGFVEVRVTARGMPASARVRLYWRGPADRNTGQTDWRLAGAAETGPDGAARVPARPGVYLAVARAEGFAPARKEVQRPAGEPVTRVLLALSAGATLQGRAVQKGSGDPVPLALVTLTYAAGGSAPFRRPDAPAEEQARATSDPSGRFRFDGLEPGSFRATAQATGFAMAAARVDVPADREVTLSLSPAAFVEGRVLGSDGAPAAGAEVVATGGEDAVTGMATSSGTFSLEVSPRTWALSARLGGQAGRAGAEVTVAAGATARGVTIRLGPASGIHGAVVAAGSGQPVPGAHVAVSPHDSNGDSGRAVSDRAGAFAVERLAPGSYDVAVSAEGFADVTRRGITVDPAQRFPLRVELRQNGAVEGVVRDAEGRPVESALVRASAARFGSSSPAAPPEARTDGDGAYRLTGVAAGRGSFSAVRDGALLGVTAAADVPEGGTAHLDFQLKDEGVIAGRVLRKDGSPAPPDTTVRALRSDSRGMRPEWAALPVDASGAYRASLPAGEYALAAQPPRTGGFMRDRTTVTVRAGSTTTQDLVCPDAESSDYGFSGLVLEPDGTPSPEATVRGSGSGRFGMIFFSDTDENGHFDTGRPRGDLPDSFEVLAANGGRTARALVGPGQDTLNIQLQPGATLRGHLAGGAVDSFQVAINAPELPYNQQLWFTGDRFEVRDVAGTLVHVVVTTGDARSAAVDVTLSPGGTQEVEVPLQPLATATGRIVDAVTQQPLADVALLADQGAFRNRQDFSAADGRFQVQVSAGEHTLRGFLRGYQALSRAFTAEAGQPIDLGDVPMRPLTTSP
jgi:protocatechuate 3,4-dioxygenase beta subunit